MKAEAGGAFVMSWLVFGMGIGTIEGAVALAWSGRPLLVHMFYR